MTLDDLEQPKRSFAEKKFYGARQKNFTEDKPILSAAKYRPMILVSRNVRSMQIFAGVPLVGASNDSGVVKDGKFASFSLAVCMQTLDRISTI